MCIIPVKSYGLDIMKQSKAQINYERHKERQNTENNNREHSRDEMAMNWTCMQPELRIHDEEIE